MAEERRGCIKWGCLGCGGSALLLVVTLVVLGAVQTMAPEGPRRIEEISSQPELPPLPAPPPRPGGTAESPAGDGRSLPLEAFAAETTGATGVVDLDLSVGEFFVRPGAPGSSVHLEARFDKSRFELEEKLEPQQDGGFRYTVRFRAKGGMLGLALRGGDRGNQARVEIELPPDRRLRLTGKLGTGESELQLGGLWLDSVDLELGTGEHIVEFDQPTLLPVESVRLDKGVGEMRIHRLGNASPKSATISQRIGNLQLDLEGAWQRDATLEVECGIGECAIEAPDNARLEVDRASVGIGEKSIDLPSAEDLPAGAPTLRLRVSGSIGEVTVD